MYIGTWSMKRVKKASHCPTSHVMAGGFCPNQPQCPKPQRAAQLLLKDLSPNSLKFLSINDI